VQRNVPTFFCLFLYLSENILCNMNLIFFYLFLQFDKILFITILNGTQKSLIFAAVSPEMIKELTSKFILIIFLKVTSHCIPWQQKFLWFQNILKTKLNFRKHYFNHSIFIYPVKRRRIIILALMSQKLQQAMHKKSWSIKSMYACNCDRCIISNISLISCKAHRKIDKKRRDGEVNERIKI
jgi:hypothetical protein